MSCGGSSYLYNLGIPFAPLCKLIECESPILINVHEIENFVHPLFSSGGAISVMGREGLN